MKNISKRRFYVGECIYIINWDGIKEISFTSVSWNTWAVVELAFIREVNLKNNTLIVGTDYDSPKTYKTYSVDDYNLLFFDRFEDAKKIADELPKTGTIVYQVIGRKVYKKLVKGIFGEYSNNIYDLVVRFDKGKNISIKQVGHSLFLNEKCARKNIC